MILPVILSVHGINRGGTDDPLKLNFKPILFKVEQSTFPLSCLAGILSILPLIRDGSANLPANCFLQKLVDFQESGLIPKAKSHY